MAYVGREHDEGYDGDRCVFCSLPREEDDERAYILHRGRLAYVIMNAFPYNNGHLMVVPDRHVGRLADMEPEELTEFIQLTQMAERVLTDLYRPHGFNLGLNLGKPAGAGVLDHLHMHLVPRWNGDTNFMTVLGETRVLPEVLSESATKVRDAFARLTLR